MPSMSVDNWIQAAIVFVLALTSLLNFLTYKDNRKRSMVILFTELLNEERILDNNNVDQDHVIFNLYEYMALLLFRKEIDIQLFYNYFNFSISELYLKFMESPIFTSSRERILMYPFLSKLFNILGLSVKEIPDDLK